MIKVFFGEDRIRAKNEIEKLLGTDYEVIDCVDLTEQSLPTIFHGATFYLVANLNPSEGTNYTVGSLDRIFSKDCATQVHLTISEGWPDKDGDGKPDPDLDEKGQPKPLTGLATATYGMPRLDISRPTLGLSVNLRWEEGLWYEALRLSRRRSP